MTVIKCGANTARKIIINIGDKDETQYTLLPGGVDAPAIEVPASVVGIEFVKDLISTGDIVVVGNDHTVSESDNIDSLRNQCKLLGIDYGKNWNESKLQQAIDEATA